MSDPLTNTFIIKSLIDLRGELKSLYNAGKDEIQYLLDDGLLSYAVSQKEKFEKLKTFLYQHDRVNFYDTFYPLDLFGIKPNGNTYTVNIDKNLTETFNDGNCVTIIGDAGSGKSMLMKHFFLHFLNYEMEIPLFIELRNLNSFEGSFYDYIIKSIFNNRLSPNDTILERLISKGKFLFLLDGYDELHEVTKHKRKDEINQFIDKYRKNYFIISSRRGAGAETLPRFNNLEVSQIMRSEILDFVGKQLSILDNKNILEEKIIKVINDPQNDDYVDYMSNPLLLTMFIFTFKNHPELPHKKSKFYYNVFETLCTRHDNFSKSGDIHERKTKLKIEDFEEILKWFSFYSYFDGKFNFDKQYLVSKLEFIKKKKGYEFDIEDLIYDLTVNIAIIIIDGLEYKFPHRSLQEYFIALLMSQRPSNKKIEAYKIKYFDKGRNPEYNLWTISDELDTYYFRAALISELGELLGVLNINNNDDLILKYLKLIDMTTFIYKGDDEDEPECSYYTKWADVLLYYIPEKNNIIFYSFIYTRKLQELVETNVVLSENSSYTIAPIEHISILDIEGTLNEGAILETENYFAINFREDINVYLLPYFKEIGLHLFVEGLIDRIEALKNNLEKSIIRMQIIEDELFDFN